VKRSILILSLGLLNLQAFAGGDDYMLVDYLTPEQKSVVQTDNQYSFDTAVDAATKLTTEFLKSKGQDLSGCSCKRKHLADELHGEIQKLFEDLDGTVAEQHIYTAINTVLDNSYELQL
jgi:hypothetical protein